MTHHQHVKTENFFSVLSADTVKTENHSENK